MNQNLMSDKLYERKLEFLLKMKNRVRASYADMINSPQAIPSVTRLEWKNESEINDHLFELIYEDIARLRGLDK
jgi:hypothetical protein